MRRKFLAFALICVGVYFGVAILSVMIAHVLLVLQPKSGSAERIIAPIARGLEFVDMHWKSILILVGPLALPAARDLVPRLRKAWGFEFDPVPLEPVGGVREKPIRDNQEQV
jgi:hypothetical protein